MRRESGEGEREGKGGRGIEGEREEGEERGEKQFKIVKSTNVHIHV